MTASSTRTVILWISRRALRWCYREVHYVGRDRVPKSGATMLFGNHPNDLPDVLAGFFATDRPLRYVATISATLMPLAQATYRGMRVIPVLRVRDVRKMRTSGVDIAAVNRSAFDVIREAFEAGDIVGIFPEGGVHDSSEIGKPRAGVAKMALESIDTVASNDLTLVAFGIQYEAQQTPRSDMLVVTGQPFSLRAWMAGEQSPTARTLSERLHSELRTVARSSRTWALAKARNRLTAAVAAITADDRRPLLETAAEVQKRCSALVEEPESEGLVQWRTIADELAQRVTAAGGIPTSSRDTARVLDAAGIANPQAAWPSMGWLVGAAIPAIIGLLLNGPMQRFVWWYAKRTTEVRTDTMARAILPGLHLILLGWVVLGGLFALGFRAASVSSWWAVPVVMALPRLGDLGLAWRDAARALRLRSRVQRLPDAERAAIRAAADRVRSAWMALPSALSSS